MGSIDHDETLYGTFNVPIWDEEPQSNPATRPYLAPPKPKNIQYRKFPLVDFRPEVFNCPTGGDYSKDAAFMSKHGFTAVKHVSSSITSRTDFEADESRLKAYHTEVQDLVKQVTGCKEVIVTVSVCRGGKPPSDSRDGIAFKGVGQTKEEATAPGHRKDMLQPIRLPHCDDTPAGGRQFIRSGMMEMRDAARRAGIIDREDEICAAAGVEARKRESQQILHEKYNDHATGRLGPRYAGFSIWRPLNSVTRDPLALVSWSTVQQNGDYVVWPYDNRTQGIDGDWTKELAMLKVKPAAAEKIHVEKQLQFSYISQQQRDEVLFVKMFDTAALGDGATEESGCLHGSPDLGDFAYGDERQSIEVRCYAFW